MQKTKSDIHISSLRFWTCKNGKLGVVYILSVLVATFLVHLWVQYLCRYRLPSALPDPPVFFITGIVCLVSFLISLCFATRTGSYVFSLFDSFSANIPLLIIAFIELLAMSYIYGLQRYCASFYHKRTWNAIPTWYAFIKACNVIFYIYSGRPYLGLGYFNAY